MTQVYDFKSPWKDKDATTVNDTVNDTAYTFLNSWNDDTSDSSKQVETSKEPIKDTNVHGTSVGTTNVDPFATRVGIIGQGGIVPSARWNLLPPGTLTRRAYTAM